MEKVSEYILVGLRIVDLSFAKMRKMIEESVKAMLKFWDAYVTCANVLKAIHRFEDAFFWKSDMYFIVKLYTPCTSL